MAIPSVPRFQALSSLAAVLALRRGLGRALSCLCGREQQIIILYYRQELTMKQIADRLEVDESRVSQLHSAALARLRTSVDSLREPRHEISTLGLRLTFQEKESGRRHRPPGRIRPNNTAQPHCEIP